METFSGYFVILWLIPAILFIAIPLAALTLWLCAKGGKQVANTFSPTVIKPREVPSSEDKRKNERFGVTNLRAEISDGLGSFSGLVDNISRMGLCLKNVPESLSVSNALLSVVVTNNNETYRVVARPRWERWHSSGVKTIGAEIASYPQNWKDFVTTAA